MLPPDAVITRHLDAAIESSARGRRILLLAVTASVFIASAALGDRPWFNWGSIRLAECTKRAASCKQEHNYLEDVAKRNYVDAPAFGVRLDVNDLGLVGGATLLIISLMLRSSISRELQNVRFVFDSACDGDEIIERYRILAMHQVITPVPIEASDKRLIQARFARALFYPVPVAYTLLIIVDLSTAFKMGPYTAACVAIVCFEVAILLTLLFITSRTLLLVDELDKVWNFAAKRTLDATESE